MNGYLVDTNIPSELTRETPDARVAAFLKNAGKESVFLSVMTIGEICKGIDLLPVNDCRYSAQSVNQFVSAVKFLYEVTLEAPIDTACLLRARFPNKAPIILSQQEVARFLDHVTSIRFRAALIVDYGASLRVSEVVAFKVADIDSQRMLLRIQQGKGQRDRYAMLSPRLLQVLRAWYRAARPTDWLFPGWRANRHLTPASLQSACHDAARQAGLRKHITVRGRRMPCPLSACGGLPGRPTPARPA